MEKNINNDFNENIKCYDEPHSPKQLKELFKDYVNITRNKIMDEKSFFSFYLQCETIYKLSEVRDVLEIGPGSGITSLFLKYLGLNYFTLDAQEVIKPDILANFETFNAKDYIEHYDLVAAFQILEHIKYEKFKELINKMQTMSKKYVFISVPYYGKTFRLDFKIELPKFLQKILPRRIVNYFKERHTYVKVKPHKNIPNRRYRTKFVKEFPLAIHYWEIGRGEITKESVFKDIRSVGLDILESFHSKEHPYHFFILCKKQGV